MNSLILYFGLKQGLRGGSGAKFEKNGISLWEVEMKIVLKRHLKSILEIILTLLMNAYDDDKHLRTLLFWSKRTNSSSRKTFLSYCLKIA